MRIWTNIKREGKSGENIFNIPGEDMSWAKSMGVNDINGIWTLHQDHMVRVTTFVADQGYLKQN